MERKVGEIFEYNGEWYQCMHVPQKHSCKLCDLRGLCCDNNGVKIVTCVWRHREDNTSVIFKKLEKVGEPIRVENKLYQKIKVPDAVCNNCAFYSHFSRDCKLNGYINHYPAYSCLTNEMFVEIKQNKEDMEEKKLNLKEFNIEAAKAGKPVCTRDGRKARIICFDAKCDKPIVALIYDCNKETVLQYLENGRFFVDQIDKYDLMMISEKKIGYMNLYRYGNNIKFGLIYNAMDKCIDSKKSEGYIATAKIEWEE